MKKNRFLILTLCLIISGLMIKEVKADDILTANIFDENDLLYCLSNESNMNTCVLGSSINLTNAINFTEMEEKVLDLNGYNITGQDDLNELFYISGGSLVVKDSSTSKQKGTISGVKDVFYLQGNESLTRSETKAELVIEKGVNIVSETSNCVYIRGNGSKLYVYGNLTSNGDYSVIQGNGTKNENTDAGNTEIIIYEGASVINTYSYIDENTIVNPAIYHPQSGKLTVEGGTISGVTGIEMRSGDLIVNGGTIIGMAPKTVVKNNGNGPAIMGAGIGIAQHTTIQPVSITINGGTIKGATALYEATPENPHDENIVSLDVADGTFISATANGDTVYSENKTEFISGGTFSTSLKKDYLKEGYSLQKDINNNYVVVKTSSLSNPDTSDNITKYVISLIISLLAIVAFVCLRKRNN